MSVTRKRRNLNVRLCLGLLSNRAQTSAERAPCDVDDGNAKKKEGGPLRESNPRPLPPEGRIIPLDQAAFVAVSQKAQLVYLASSEILAPLPARAAAEA